MIDTKKSLEKKLQQRRFDKVKDWIQGDVLDFGGNEGELKPMVLGDYTLVNYDHAPIMEKTYDTIVSLAVVEHLHINEVYNIFSIFKKQLRPKGKIILTTPTPRSKPILDTFAFFHILDKQNIEEHKHYWTEQELTNLAVKSQLEIIYYDQFQLGCNQLVVMQHTSQKN